MKWVFFTQGNKQGVLIHGHKKKLNGLDFFVQ